MANDELVWTERGRTALALAKQWDTFHHGDDPDDQLRDQVVRAVDRFAPAWALGLDQADAAGREAVAYATEALRTGGLPPDATVEQAASAASLLGAYADVIGAFLEQLIRTRGVRFALAVLVRMWSQRTIAREQTRWSEDGLQVWLTAVRDGDKDAHSDVVSLGAGVSPGKRKAARYLLRTHQAASEATRAEMAAAVDQLWSVAPAQARAPLVLATDDRVRAAQLARDLPAQIDEGVDDDGVRTVPYPAFALWHLPYLLTDVALVEGLLARSSAHLDLRILENLGAAALPLYERQLGKYKTSSWRQPILRDLCNLRGPRTARIMAAYAERRPYATLVHNYFADAPELLLGLRRLRSLAAHRPQLEKLEKRLGLTGTSGRVGR